MACFGNAFVNLHLRVKRALMGLSPFEYRKKWGEMMSFIKGKNAIVTGGAVGLGSAYARALAGAGANISVCDIREEVHDVGRDIEKLGIKSISWIADVSKPDDVRRVVDGTREIFGSIDILINNAGAFGVSVADDDLDKTLEDYDRIVDTNLKGEYLFGRAVIPIMIAQGSGGEIVNIATDHHVTCGTPNEICPNLPTCPWNSAGTFQFDGPPRPTGGGDSMDLYDASKWAINGLTYGWAKALTTHGIRVNGFCMGATDSHMLRSFHDDPTPEEVASWMSADDNAAVLIALLEEGPDGRNAENMNFCVGRPVVLEPSLEPIYVMKEDINVVTR